MLSKNEAQDILESSDLIWSADDVAAAVDRLAGDIGAALSERHPVVLCVMGGAVVFTGNLLPRLTFPLELDYLHVTRYGAATTGGTLNWLVEPRHSVAGRTVLVLDDILDEGITLAAIKERLMKRGAAACYTAVLAEKELGREKPIAADFVGLKLPNRYVFGYGMDVSGAWRNLPSIHAVKGK
ncbi:MAG: hypoxanthine-guanine phosphoribosyltransferase [Rhodocyclaceae bacterium]|nr:hypoxanthine-guanine phosphoribosyltransferase [Rhodocyclaceae bacterium]